MQDWKGCRGLDDEVARLVTNAMPPFLIGNEQNTPIPFSASNDFTCMQRGAISSPPTFTGFNEGPRTHPSSEDMALWSSILQSEGPLFPTENLATNQTIASSSHCIPQWWELESGFGPYPPNITNQNLLPNSGVDTFFATNAPQEFEVNPQNVPRISTCWEILTLRLGQWVEDRKKQALLITDEMLQQQARWILYESDDTWNQTAADNTEWLELFKKAHGLPSTATDEYVDLMEDLGMGVGDMTFDTLLQDNSWDAV